MDAVQINRQRADGTDAIQTQLRSRFSAHGFQRIMVVKHAAGGFAMRGPEPCVVAERGELAAEQIVIERFAPRKFHGFEIEFEPPRLIYQALAELAIAHDQSARAEER